MRMYNHGVLQSYYPVGAHFEDVRTDFVKISKYFFENIDLKEIENKTINLFCIGSSGLITASIFANYAIENYSGVFSLIKIIDLKKDGENSHGESFKYFDIDKKSENENVNIIIDDFVSSGRTIANIISKIDEKLKIYRRDLKFSVWSNSNDIVDKITFHSLIVSSGLKDSFIDKYTKTFKYVFIE